MGWKKTAAVVFILSLVFINIYLFSGLFNNNVACYRDMCVYGQTANITKELRQMVSSADSVIIYVEGDASATQTTGYIDQVFLQLYADMIAANKAPTYALISLDSSGTAVNCSCETYSNGNSTACVNSSLDYCRSLSPKEGQLMFIIKYPDYPKNEVILTDNIVDIRANSGASLSGMFDVLRKMIFP